MKYWRSWVVVVGLVVVGGCARADKHAEKVHSSKEREMTVGIVQKEIHQGMSAAEVAEALGSPNIVTSDKVGDETWIYDKIATEASFSQSRGFGTVLLLGYVKEGGARATTQKTLTVVIKFSKEKKVKEFSYHASKF